jgi:uncharacterized protein (DUF927 family)
MGPAEKQQQGASSENSTRLLPAHRKLLKERYGLWDETIDDWGPISATQEDLANLNFAPRVEAPGILLPILSPGRRKACDFLYRSNHPREDQKIGKLRRRKYELARGATNHIHVPRAVQVRLFGPDGNQVRILVITEGPIKAEVAAQHGIDCVAAMGVWNWLQKFGDESVPIEDLNRIPWSQFDAVIICFDSDAATNPLVLKAERALATWLLKHGAAKVLIVRLSPAADGSKVGLDDFLQDHSVKDFNKLPRLAFDAEPPLDDLVATLRPDTEKADRNRILGRVLDEEHDRSEQERLLKIAAQQTKLPIRALRTSAQNASAILRRRRGANNLHAAKGSAFEVKDEGIFWQGGPQSLPVKLSARVDVIAETCDANGENWGRQLEWRDSEGRKHTWTMPMELLAGDAAAVRAYLLSGGLPFMTTNRQLRERFIEYLQTAPAEKFVRCVARIGWHDGSYVLPQTVISPENAEKILYQTSHDAGHHWNARGTAEDWRENVGSLCSGNSRLILSVSCAFAGSLLNPVGAESGGIHYHGPTSTGKSTALIVGGSVCGGGGQAGFIQSWRATANGLEAVAAAHNDAALFLDELSQVDPREAAEIAYLLGNGQGKARMDRNTVGRKRSVWRLLYVSAGELTLAEHVGSVGKRTRGGAEVRLLNIEADAGAGMGMFEDLHGVASPDVFANQLKAAAQRYYGAVYLKYLDWLVRHRVKAEKVVRMAQKKFQDSVVPPGSTGEVRRAAERFALIGAAGELATRIGLTGWQWNESIRYARRVFREWLKNRRTTGPSDADAGIEAVRSFILEHGISRFQSTQSSFGSGRPETIRDRVGFVRMEGGKPMEYYFFPETFRSEVCKGYSYKEVSKTLDARRLLRREPPNMTMKPNLPGVGRTRVYCVLASIIQDDQSEPDSNVQDSGQLGTLGTSPQTQHDNSPDLVSRVTASRDHLSGRI